MSEGAAAIGECYRGKVPQYFFSTASQQKEFSHPRSKLTSPKYFHCLPHKLANARIKETIIEAKGMKKVRKVNAVMELYANLMP